VLVQALFDEEGAFCWEGVRLWWFEALEALEMILVDQEGGVRLSSSPFGKPAKKKKNPRRKSFKNTKLYLHLKGG